MNYECCSGQVLMLGKPRCPGRWALTNKQLISCTPWGAHTHTQHAPCRVVRTHTLQQRLCPNTGRHGPCLRHSCNRTMQPMHPMPGYFTPALWLNSYTKQQLTCYAQGMHIVMHRLKCWVTLHLTPICCTAPLACY